MHITPVSTSTAAPAVPGSAQGLSTACQYGNHRACSGCRCGCHAWGR